ncbi:hypothetical protein [Chromobacterium phragmitis]|uniref:Uncharacterized protein n=1 Tax=Chromobacterium phragmitis TaxID=2202141 RepID=A0ABV0J0W7_9NEIS
MQNAGKFEVDPSLPIGFDQTPNQERPESHAQWWGVPYIETADGKFIVRCLDGGAWDRPTFLGERPTLEEAIALCEEAAARPLRKCESCGASTLTRYWGAVTTFMPGGKPEQVHICPCCQEIAA